MNRAGSAHITQILDDLRRIFRVLRESSRSSERRFRVTGAQLFALKAVAQVDSLSLNELAARTRTHQSTVSTVVKKLVTAGLVSRVVSREDGRRLELAVTPKGKRLLAKAPHAAQEQLFDGLERLPAERREVLAGALHALVSAMRLEDEVPTMFLEEDSTTPAAPRIRRRA